MAQGAQYAGNITVTSTGNVVAFGFGAHNLLVINDGTSYLYLNITTTSGASSADYLVKNGESVSIAASQGYYTGLSVVAASTTVNEACRILATR